MEEVRGRGGGGSGRRGGIQGCVEKFRERVDGHTQSMRTYSADTRPAGSSFAESLTMGQ